MNLFEKHWTAYARCAAMGCIILSLGCASTREAAYVDELPESGQRELSKQKFRGRWWSYYQRGAILMRYGRYTEAEEDFRIAMGKRAEDGRWARTYGLHFLPEYFPNRELGIAFYEQGDFESAEVHLQKSYEHAKSARAAHYLNRVRERRIRDRNEDQTPPVIELMNPAPGPVGDLTYPLRIRVTDDTFVQSVRVNGEAVRTIRINGRDEPFELWLDSLEMEKAIALAPGPNAIEVAATDLVGKQTIETFQLAADHDGPALHYEIAAGERELRGRIADETGIESLVLGGQRVSLTATTGQDSSFSYPVDSARLGAGIEYVAQDVLGNLTRGTIGRASAVRAARADKLALAIEDSAVARWISAAQPPDGVDDSGPLQVALLNLANDQRYYDESIIANIAVESDSAVTSIQVNGEDIPGIVATSGPQRVSRRIHLDEVGEHRIVVRVTNRDENVQQTEVLIQRLLPQVLDNKARLSVAVLGDFWVGGAEVIPDVVDFVKGDLSSAVAQKGRFNVIGSEFLTKVLGEQELSAALSDPKDAVRTGLLQGADYLLIGDARRFGPNIEIVLHAIDAASGRKVSVDVYGPGSTTAEAGALTALLGDRLAQLFPLAHGEITSIGGSGASLIAQLGARDMVWDSLPCIVYREVDMLDPATGQSEGKDMIPVAQGVITKVRQDSSDVKLHEGESGAATDRPLPTDLIIMK